MLYKQSQYCLIGDPVAHSLSPVIFDLFADQCGIHLRYLTKQVAAADLEPTIIEFFEQDGSGLNVTAPYKTAVIPYLHALTPRAQTAQAVNVISMDSDKNLIGDNADGQGFITDLKNKNIELKQKRWLIMGAGGGARGILPAILETQPSVVTVVTRAAERLATLSEQFPSIDVGDYSITRTLDVDIVVNATSASLSGDIPAIAPNCLKDTVAYDLVYQKRNETVFQTFAKAQGASNSFDGLGMLVEQAAVAFNLWEAKAPDTKKVILQLR